MQGPREKNAELFDTFCLKDFETSRINVYTNCWKPQKAFYPPLQFDFSNGFGVSDVNPAVHELDHLTWHIRMCTGNDITRFPIHPQHELTRERQKDIETKIMMAATSFIRSGKTSTFFPNVKKPHLEKYFLCYITLRDGFMQVMTSVAATSTIYFGFS